MNFGSRKGSYTIKYHEMTALKHHVKSKSHKTRHSVFSAELQAKFRAPLTVVVEHQGVSLSQNDEAHHASSDHPTVPEFRGGGYVGIIVARSKV